MDSMGIVGLIALLVGLCLSTLAIRDYFLRLRMIPTWIEVELADNNTALVLLRISFVNLSSRGQVVRDVRPISTLDNAGIATLMVEADPNRQTVTCSISNVSRRLPFDEWLQPPIHIPPYQCLNKWMVFGLDYTEAYPTDITIVNIEAVSAGKTAKVICRLPQVISFDKSRSVPINLYPVKK
jgi:hypothetical protein